jgi:hypothetical protein
MIALAILITLSKIRLYKFLSSGCPMPAFIKIICGYIWPKESSKDHGIWSFGHFHPLNFEV